MLDLGGAHLDLGGAHGLLMEIIRFRLPLATLVYLCLA